MSVTIRVEGINLEKLMRDASQAGILLRDLTREGDRAIRVRIRAGDLRAFYALCDRQGWTAEELRAEWLLRALRFLDRRRFLAAGMLLGALMVYASSQMILAVRIDNAQEYIAEVRNYLAEQGVRPGRLKRAFSTDALREGLSLRLPGLAFAALRYEGSTLVADCRAAVQGENTAISGEGMDIVAAQSGIITRISAVSGTPQVREGQAVHKGQVLILGQERTQQGGVYAVQAQGQVMARVFYRGDARAPLYETQTVETGRTRRRVTLKSPWHTRVVRDAKPFASQDAGKRTQSVVGLFLPLYREIEVFAETVVTKIPRKRTDAMAVAQGAAQEMAKKQCPQRALILDKWVDYSMIDNEFVYATVVLEIEDSIAGRLSGPAISN